MGKQAPGAPPGPEGVTRLFVVEVVLGGGPSEFDLGVRDLGEPGERAVEAHFPPVPNPFGSRTPRVHSVSKPVGGAA